jgi:prophage regulatory protein
LGVAGQDSTAILIPGGFANDQKVEARPVPDPDSIIRLKTVLARTGLSRSTLYRKISDGTFPRQVKISMHGAGWHESAVGRWIADPASYRESDVGRTLSGPH